MQFFFFFVFVFVFAVFTYILSLFTLSAVMSSGKQNSATLDEEAFCGG